MKYEYTFKVNNESRYSGLFVVSGSFRKPFSTECVNIYFSQSIVWGYPALLISWFINLKYKHFKVTLHSCFAGKSNIVKNTVSVWIRITKTEIATEGVLYEKVFLEISQNSQENTSTRVSFFNKVAGLSLLKKRPWHRCFPVNLAKFLRTPFLQNICGRLLL